jgi:hypothetical protein
MGKLTTFIIGFIILTATATTLITVATQLTNSYGITTDEMFADNKSICSASFIATDIERMMGKIQNSSVDAATHAPGQENAQVSSTITASSQQSGVVTALLFIPNLLTLSSDMIAQLACYLGVPPHMTIAIQLMILLIIVILIAGIFNYREY